jgi:hypothetical protein
MAVNQSTTAGSNTLPMPAVPCSVCPPVPGQQGQEGEDAVLAAGVCYEDEGRIFYRDQHGQRLEYQQEHAQHVALSDGDGVRRPWNHWNYSLMA